MKKKLVLVVAMILVAITACACLAGCVPNRPDKFLAAFIKSDHKGIVTGEAETGIDGNKIIVKVNDKNQTIYEETKDKLNIYICIAGNWTAESIAIDKVDNDYKELKESMTSEETPEQLKAISENFEENFEKDKEGWWKLKSKLADVAGMEFKIEGNEMLTKVKVIGLEGELSTQYVLNFKISIPKEAKEALKK